MIVSAGWRGRRRRSREQQPPSPHILLSWSSYRVANNEGEREEGRIEGGRGESRETKEEGRFLRSTELFSSWLLSPAPAPSSGMSLGMGAPSNGFSSCVGRGNVADMKANDMLILRALLIEAVLSFLLPWRSKFSPRCSGISRCHWQAEQARWREANATRAEEFN